jgi:hypothetical protein
MGGANLNELVQQKSPSVELYQCLLPDFFKLWRTTTAEEEEEEAKRGKGERENLKCVEQRSLVSGVGNAHCPRHQQAHLGCECQANVPHDAQNGIVAEGNRTTLSWTRDEGERREATLAEGFIKSEPVGCAPRKVPVMLLVLLVAGGWRPILACCRGLS